MTARSTPRRGASHGDRDEDGEDRTAKTFDVSCPACHSEDGTVTIDLNDLSECRCTECDWTGTPREALELVQEEARKWARVVRWVELAATIE